MVQVLIRFTKALKGVDTDKVQTRAFYLEVSSAKCTKNQA